MLKCLWNIYRKADNLWVLWIHIYYLKGTQILDVENGNSWSWIFQDIILQRDSIPQIHLLWHKMLIRQKFPMKQVYDVLIDDMPRVPWRYLLYLNPSSPRALINT